jgi:hypothetical protein
MKVENWPFTSASDMECLEFSELMFAFTVKNSQIGWHEEEDDGLSKLIRSFAPVSLPFPMSRFFSPINLVLTRSMTARLCRTARIRLVGSRVNAVMYLDRRKRRRLAIPERLPLSDVLFVATVFISDPDRRLGGMEWGLRQFCKCNSQFVRLVIESSKVVPKSGWFRTQSYV